MTPSLPNHAPAPSWNGLRTAAVGLADFDDTALGARQLVDACEDLKAQGYQAVVGPMDGSTWGKYRLPIETDGSPCFAMEPTSRAKDLATYQAAGFSVAEQHVSSSVVPGRQVVGTRAGGMRVESWNGKNPESLLAEAHRIVMDAFAKTAFFTPIPIEVFVAATLPLLKMADPAMILQAIDAQGQVVGATFSFMDPFRHGALILKTCAAVSPGAGRMMINRIHAIAEETGANEVVHALMRQGNTSCAVSQKYDARIFRRYALMGKIL